MRAFACVCGCLILIAVPALAQGPAPATAEGPASPALAQLQTTAQAINLDISRLRIEKWKIDSANKKQAQDNADSISRNVATALPALVNQARDNPRSLAAMFKLYRNVNALYDVFSSVAESAGAFGSKSEFETLAKDIDSLETVRRSLGDSLESAAFANDAELARLRNEVAQAKAVVPAPASKKIIVDDEEKPKKPVVKKKPAAKPAEKPATDKNTAATGSSGSGSGATQPPPKQ